MKYVYTAFFLVNTLNEFLITWKNFHIKWLLGFVLNTFVLGKQTQ